MSELVADLTGIYRETNEKILPHPLCKVCANWLPDIEDIVKNPSTIKGSSCINQWSNSKSNKLNK